ncbi:MAG: T9SS type A sorting domain-containing protein [Flavobacteriaceae bacterium]|nr:T9SS type A sorting domain-containing protein [Flavobacteriaceae bacterium]
MKRPLYFLSVFMVVFSIQSQIVNKGILKIENGTDVFFGANYTNDTGSTHSNNGNLYLKGNFTNNATTDALFGTTFFRGTSLQNIGGSASQIVFFNMEVDNSGNHVSVANNKALVVKNKLTLTASHLRLTGEAQLLQTHTGNSTNSGTGALYRDQQGTSDKYKYNYWSSPVNVGGEFKVNMLNDGTDVTSDPFADTDIRFTALNDGTPALPITISTEWIWKYINKPPNDETMWEYVGAVGILLPGQGYTMKGPGSTALGIEQNYVFRGTPNSGDYSHTISANNESLLGNPYPSALDANQFISNNSTVLDPTTGLLFWEHWGGSSHYTVEYQGGYAHYSLGGGAPASSHPLVNQSGTGTKTPGRYIPIGQGFFIRANSTGGNIVFNNAQRVFQAEGATSVFIRQQKTTKTTAETQRIRLGHVGPTGYERQILLALNADLTDGLNDFWDAIMASVNPNDMFWVYDQLKLAIRARPFRLEMEVPLGFVSAVTGIHKVRLDATEDFDLPIFLKDKINSTYSNLRLGEVQFELAPGENLTRYAIVFEDKTLDIDEQELNLKIKVYFTDKTDEIILLNPSIQSIKSLKVYNNLGQLVLEKNNLIPSSEVKIPFSKTKGVYFIKIIHEKGEVSKKIIN